MNDLFTSTDWGRGVGGDYYNSPIPQERDEKITELLKTWMSLDEEGRRGSASHISKQPYPPLFYSERMASLAVRQRNPELILLGLVALGVDGWRFDFRENLSLVPLHYDAAQRIGENPEPIFERAAALLFGKAADGLRAFLRRSASDKSLKVMGFTVGADENGFRYKRLP